MKYYTYAILFLNYIKAEVCENSDDCDVRVYGEGSCCHYEEERWGDNVYTSQVCRSAYEIEFYNNFFADSLANDDFSVKFECLPGAVSEPEEPEDGETEFLCETSDECDPEVYGENSCCLREEEYFGDTVSTWQQCRTAAEI